MFGLETWCRSLAAICDQFVRAAAGDADIAFWRRVYNPIEVAKPNPLLELPIGEPRDVARDPDGFYRGPGISSDQVPATLSRVRVNINDRVGRLNRAVALHAGLVGVAQDEDGALRPLGGWHLAPATVEIDDVIDRIVRDHETGPPVPHRWVHTSAELVALYRRIGSGTMFDGAWRLPPAADHRWIRRGARECPIETIIDLADGRSLGAAVGYDARTLHWVVCRTERVAAENAGDNGFRLVDDPADVPVYGTSLAFLLDAALDTGGDISHLETGRLDQLDEPAT